jgi:hypothetical protein
VGWQHTTLDRLTLLPSGMSWYELFRVMMRKERKINAIDDGQSAGNPLATLNISKDGLTSSLTMYCHSVLIRLALPNTANVELICIQVCMYGPTYKSFIPLRRVRILLMWAECARSRRYIKAGYTYDIHHSYQTPDSIHIRKGHTQHRIMLYTNEEDRGSSSSLITPGASREQGLHPVWFLK